MKYSDTVTTLRPYMTKVNIGSGDGLVLNSKKNIMAWTNDDTDLWCHIEAHCHELNNEDRADFVFLYMILQLLMT